MGKVMIALLVVVFFGCKDFETKKLSSDKIARDALEQVDWKNLDTYPSFAICDDNSTKTARKQCFEREFSKHIYQVLTEHEVVLKDSIHQKIKLTIGISAKGEPEIEKSEIPQAVSDQIPKIKSWLVEAVADLPKIYPAEKRGIPVAVTFKLPLVIQSN